MRCSIRDVPAVLRSSIGTREPSSLARPRKSFATPAPSPKPDIFTGHFLRRPMIHPSVLSGAYRASIFADTAATLPLECYVTVGGPVSPSFSLFSAVWWIAIARDPFPRFDSWPMFFPFVNFFLSKRYLASDSAFVTGERKELLRPLFFNCGYFTDLKKIFY